VFREFLPFIPIFGRLGHHEEIHRGSMTRIDYANVRVATADGE
jgi:hypothetical protein